MNTKLHIVTDANGRLIRVFRTARKVSNSTGAAALLDGLPKPQSLPGDRGYDADRCSDTPLAKGIKLSRRDGGGHPTTEGRRPVHLSDRRRAERDNRESPTRPT